MNCEKGVIESGESSIEDDDAAMQPNEKIVTPSRPKKVRENDMLFSPRSAVATAAAMTPFEFIQTQDVMES